MGSRGCPTFRATQKVGILVFVLEVTRSFGSFSTVHSNANSIYTWQQYYVRATIIFDSQSPTRSIRFIPRLPETPLCSALAGPDAAYPPV